MKIGDLVQSYTHSGPTGIIIGFNEKGEGGKDYVHVFEPDGTIGVFLAASLMVVDESR